MIFKRDPLDRGLARNGRGHDERCEQTDDGNYDDLALHEFRLPGSMSDPNVLYDRSEAPRVDFLGDRSLSVSHGSVNDLARVLPDAELRCAVSS